MARGEKEGVDFSGVIPGMPFSRRWALKGEEERNFVDVLKYTANLGKTCETAVFQLWQGELDVTPYAEPATIALRTMLIEKRRLWNLTDGHDTPHQRNAAVFKDMGRPQDPLSGQGPVNEGFRDGLRIADAAFGFKYQKSLWGMYNKIHREEALPDSRLVYLAETTAILLRELSQPTIAIGSADNHRKGIRTFTNQAFAIPAGPGIQFDALTVPRGLVSQNGKINEKDLFIYPKRLGGYTVWELKCLFRAKESERDDVSSCTLRAYERETKRRFGMVAAAYLEKYQTFNFPEYVVLCVLRGFAPPLIKYIRFGSEHLTKWADGLEIQQIGRTTAEQQKAQRLIDELRRQSQIWGVEEKSESMELEKQLYTQTAVAMMQARLFDDNLGSAPK